MSWHIKMWVLAKEITNNIMKHYTKGTILVVANPVDILTYMIQKWSELPNGKVIGTGTTLWTVLDSDTN